MRLNFMKNLFIKAIGFGVENTAESSILTQFIDTQSEVAKLPQLSPVEKVQFEQELAIDHLYYSSKIEGSNLSQKRLTKAIHAQ